MDCSRRQMGAQTQSSKQRSRLKIEGFHCTPRLGIPETTFPRETQHSLPLAFEKQAVQEGHPTPHFINVLLLEFWHDYMFCL